MRYTQKYLEENTDVNEVWTAIAAGAKELGGELLDKAGKLIAAGLTPSRNTHATPVPGQPDPNQRRGTKAINVLKRKLERSSGDGDSSTNQSTPTKADTATEKYTDTENAFIKKRQNLAKFDRVT